VRGTPRAANSTGREPVTPTRIADRNREESTMAHDHSFDCRQCGAHLDSQDELNRHIRENHSAQSKSGSSQQGSNPSNPSNRRPDDSSRL
jgi:hypothetical protein